MCSSEWSLAETTLLQVMHTINHSDGSTIRVGPDHVLVNNPLPACMLYQTQTWSFC